MSQQDDRSVSGDEKLPGPERKSPEVIEYRDLPELGGYEPAPARDEAGITARETQDPGDEGPPSPL